MIVDMDMSFRVAAWLLVIPTALNLVMGNLPQAGICAAMSGGCFVLHLMIVRMKKRRLERDAGGKLNG
jgi:hypothetical protein